MFKGVDFFPHGKRYPIIVFRRIFVGASIALVVAALVLLATRGLNYGIDFKGGTLIEVKARAGTIDIGELRSKVTALKLGDVQIQGIGGAGEEALIRIEEQPGGDDAQQAAATKLRELLTAQFIIRRTEVVGPAVSGELKTAGLIAVVTAIFGIMLYVWFRFEWQFSVAAILALVHDTLITMGVFSLLQLDFDLSIVAALLTLAGYSINDSVVVFDRIRENLRKYKKMDLEELMEVSINETLSRTVLTSVTTFLAVFAIYAFGTEVIRGFAFTMLFGIVIGTYSSIFVAASLLLSIGVKRDWSDTQAYRTKERGKAQV
jgi:preprotein translocase SecF subunit